MKRWPFDFLKKAFLLWVWLAGISVFSCAQSAQASQTQAQAKTQRTPSSVSDNHLAYFEDLAITIDRIEFEGARAFPSDALYALVEVDTGEILDRSRIITTEQTIQDFYRAHGYEDAGIRTRLVRKKRLGSHQLTDGLKENTIIFELMEGRPTRVGEIQLSPRLDLGAEGQLTRSRSWRFLERALLKRLDLKVGEVLDQGKLNLARRVIQEYLADQEFIGTKIESIEISDAQEPKRTFLSSLGPVKNLEVQRWVKVTVHFDLGEKVRFGFRGNSFFTRAYLDSLLTEQRLLDLGKDYVPVIQQKIEDEYRNSGFSQIKITPFYMEESSAELQASAPEKNQFGSSFNSFEAELSVSSSMGKRINRGRQVTFQIDEGARLKWDTIEFDGNLIFGDEILRDQLLARASALVQHGFFVEKDFRQASESLITWMKEQGYLSSKLITVGVKELTRNRYKGSTDPLVQIMIYLYEGEQTLIDEIHFTNFSILNQGEIEQMLELKVGSPLNLVALGDGLERLKKAYRNKGYLNFKIVNEDDASVVQYYQQNRLSRISLKANEGVQFKVSQISIEGLNKTRLPTVMREFTFKEEDVLTETHLEASESRLRRLGIFSSVLFRTVDDLRHPQHKVVYVKVQEADRGVLTWGPGIRSDLGLRLYGQLAYTNLWGDNHTASFNLAINRRFYPFYHFIEAQTQFAYSWPQFGFRDLTFRPTLQIAKNQFINFAADNLTFALSWERPILAHPNLIGNFTYTFEKIKQFNSAEAVDNQRLQIGTVTPRLSVDLRDNPLAPSRGFYGTTWMDLSYPVVGSQHNLGYYRLQARTDYYLSLGRGVSWYFSFRTGYEQTTSGYNDTNQIKTSSTPDSIPLIKQFALGGLGSLRGYQEQELNVQTQAITGSLSYVNYRTQLDLPFVGALKLGIFLDSANLLIDRYCLGDLKFSSGAGLHYLTPVGAVNFDLGIKLNPQPRSDTYRLHFSVGVI